MLPLSTIIDDLESDYDLAPGFESWPAVKSWLPIISVEERNKRVMITGIPARVLQRDIAKVWETSYINKYMFTRVNSRELVIPSFFALEFVYILESLINTPRLRINRAVLRQLVELLREKTWLSNLTAKHRDIIDKSKLAQLRCNLFQWQNEFLDEYNQMVPRLGLTGYMLPAPPGHGKTIAALALMKCLGVDTVIVVSPLIAVDDVWVKSIASVDATTPTVWASTANTSITNSQYIVVHYQFLVKLLAWIKTARLKNVGIVLDESHNVNESETVRSAQFIELCSALSCQHVLWMSGTPIKAIGSEAAPFMSTVDPLFTADVSERFMKIFGKSAARGVDILSNRIGLMTYTIPPHLLNRYETSEERVVVSWPDAKKYTLAAAATAMRDYVTTRTAYYKQNLPHYLDIVDSTLRNIRRKLSPAEWPALDEYINNVRYLNKSFSPMSQRCNEILRSCKKYERETLLPLLTSEERNQYKDAVVVVKYMSLKIIGEALGRVLLKMRIECFCAMVPYAGIPDIINNSEKKTVIFTSFIETVDAIAEYLKKLNYKPLVYHSECGQPLDAVLHKFRTESDRVVLITTFTSISTAVDLTVANSCYMFNSPVRDYVVKQTKARIARVGQDTIVRFYTTELDTGGEPNLASRYADLAEWSKQQVAAIMGYDIDKLTEELDDETLVE